MSADTTSPSVGYRPKKQIGSFIMINPQSFKGRDAQKYIAESNLDLDSVGLITEMHSELYRVRWIDASSMIREKYTDRDLLDKSNDLIFVDPKSVNEGIKNRLWLEKPIKLPDLQQLNNDKPIPDLAKLMGDMRFKGGKKSRKNRNSVKGGKSRKLYKKFCKSRKLRKSRNVRKTRRRWILHMIWIIIRMLALLLLLC